MKNILVVLDDLQFDIYHQVMLEYAEQSQINIYFFLINPLDKHVGVLKKIFLKWGGQQWKYKWYDQLREQFMSNLIKYNIDCVFFINTPYEGSYFINEKVKKKLEGINCYLLFVDAAANAECRFTFLDIFKKIFSFEYNDIRFFLKKYNYKISFVPVGSVELIYRNDLKVNDTDKEYDICFVGSSSPKRLIILNAVAYWCKKNNKKLCVVGQYWHNSHLLSSILGQLKFRKKYPELSLYVQNRFIQPNEVANIYCRSKICLNIVTDRHKGVNTRTFDILAAGGFQLCDTVDFSGIDLRDQCDLVLYRDKKDLIEKIEYYLDNENLRLEISQTGKNLVLKKYLFKHTMKKIFE